ncbi:MAG: bacteriocin fulvocin C-related protein [Sediminibacterium sp.]|nr:bacteriocin fulvocin C-related protein [Sediminibacterium sp.]
MNRITLVIIVAICMFTSCTKNSAVVDIVDEGALNAVMSLKDDRQFVNSYTLLQPAEKAELWSRHIKYFIQSHDLSLEQLAFVTSFRSQWIVKDLFEKNSPLLKTFALSLPQIRFKAIILLGIPDASSLFIDLQSDRLYYLVKNNTNTIINVPGEANKYRSNSNYCKCSQTDPYCNTGTCTSNGCTREAGCGTLWLFECNGVCQLLADS